MIAQPLNLDQGQVHKLLCAANGDAALLYLYVHSGNDTSSAQTELKLSKTRFDCAAATLRQLGLWPEEKHSIIVPGERPQYSEKDVLDAMDHEDSFRLLRGEVQRLLGRNLNTEDLKILLGFIHYLGLPSEVVSVLVSFCKDRSRQRGNLRAPSLRTIEKEAYRWAEQGIDTLEGAAAYIQTQNERNAKLYKLMDLLQIRGRSLTAAEERFANAWLEMGLSQELLTMAYERTCLNTGGLNWNYMNKILTRWHEAGFKTAEDVRLGDRKGAEKVAPRQLDEDEKAAIARMLQEV